MNKVQPFFGSLTTNRKEAFPEIISLKLKVAQDPYGYYCTNQSQREVFYSESSFPRQVPCRNPRCQQGGLDLQNYLLFSQTGQYTAHCNGHEGSPKGRRKGDPCDNVFKITMDVQRSRDG